MRHAIDVAERFAWIPTWIGGAGALYWILRFL
jgi:hypothetical protein